MYRVTLNGDVWEALAYSFLEEMFQGTPAVIRNLDTGVEWFADPSCPEAQAEREQDTGFEQ